MRLWRNLLDRLGPILRNEPRRLVAGPNAMFICEVCVDVGFGITSQLTEAKPAPPPIRLSTLTADHRCGFCGRDREQVGAMAAGPARVLICHRCLTYCRAVLDDEADAEVELPAPQQARSATTVRCALCRRRFDGVPAAVHPNSPELRDQDIAWWRQLVDRHDRAETTPDDPALFNLALALPLASTAGEERYVTAHGTTAASAVGRRPGV